MRCHHGAVSHRAWQSRPSEGAGVADRSSRQVLLGRSTGGRAPRGSADWNANNLQLGRPLRANVPLVLGMDYEAVKHGNSIGTLFHHPISFRDSLSGRADSEKRGSSPFDRKIFLTQENAQKHSHDRCDQAFPSPNRQHQLGRIRPSFRPYNDTVRLMVNQRSTRSVGVR